MPGEVGTTLTTSTATLRPALELAMTVARRGEADVPAIPAPQPLRRYLRFAKLPLPALAVARRVLEDDGDFRARVVAAADQATVGEVGWLWLTRPAGWEKRLGEIEREHQEQEKRGREQQAERDALKKLTGAEDRARRAEVALTARNEELAGLRSALTDEQSERAEAEAALAEAVDALAEQRAQRNNAVRQLKEAEALLVERTTELRRARHEARMREAELAQALTDLGRLRAEVDDVQHRALLRETSPAPQAAAGRGSGRDADDATTDGGPAAPSAAPGAADLDRAGLSAMVQGAAAAAEQLAGSLAAAAALLAPARESARAEGPRRAPEPRMVRQPLRLPPGVLDDSVEAVAPLLRARHAVVLVDGYNVSHAAWPDLSPADQRVRLVDLLAEVQVRAGVDMEIVFDGADVGVPAARSVPPRSGLRVTFSPAEVEADDVLIERCGELPPSRPVVVVSSDRRVRAGARRQGANLLSSQQLLAACRR